MEKKKRDAELKKDQVGIEKLKEEMCVVLKIFCIYMVKTVLTRQIRIQIQLKEKKIFTLKFLDAGTS